MTPLAAPGTILLDVERLSERILAAYLAYTSVLALAFPLLPGQRARVLASNAGVLCASALLARLKAWHRLDAVLRDWTPLAIMILCYHQMGWFARPLLEHGLETSWVAWDRTLLYGLGAKAAVESLGPVIPWILEASYILVYALPVFMMAMIYAYRRLERSDELLTIYILGLCLSYGQFPFWPSEPPRTLFPGQDLPVYWCPIRSFSVWMLAGQGIHTSVFPSAHVSGAVAAAFAARRIFKDKPWLRRGVPVYAALVAIATVYGRYHYAADAAAGAVVGAAAYAIGSRLYRWWHLRREAAALSFGIHRGLGLRIIHSLFRRGKEDAKSGSAPRLALHLESALVRTDDPEDRRQP
jgi:membrane-associated phospholipid phosphatase